MLVIPTTKNISVHFKYSERKYKKKYYYNLRLQVNMIKFNIGN